LGEIKTNPTLRHIPVIILTSSENEEDILGCYELQANCYVTKSTDLEQFSQTLASLSDFWFRVVRRPVLTKNT
jgi:two-component system, chemotaxis family, response regulator Rcp1